MKRMALMALGISATMFVFAGCGASTGISMFKNMSRKDSLLKVSLDGQTAKQNKLKKTATGYARFEVGEPVSTSPKFVYEIEEPDKFGHITMVQFQIHQKFEADFSDHAIICIARDTNNPEAQMKPGVVYDLSNMGPNFKLMDTSKGNQEIDRIDLVPGVDYMMVLTVRADASESVQIYFETK